MTDSILADIERAYRACNHGWLFVPNHKCSASTCDIEQMDVMSYTLEGTEPIHAFVRTVWITPRGARGSNDPGALTIFLCKQTGIGTSAMTIVVLKKF